MPENDEPLDDARAVAMNAAAAAARVAETLLRDQQQRARERAGGLASGQSAVLSPGNRLELHREEIVPAVDQEQLEQAEKWMREHRPDHYRDHENEMGFTDHVDDVRRVNRKLINGWQVETGQIPAPVEKPQPARVVTDLDRAQAWAAEHNPRAMDVYWSDREGSDSASGQESAGGGLIRKWQKATAGSEQPDTRLDSKPEYDSPERRAGVDADMKVAGVPAEVRNARSVSDLLNGTDPTTAAAAGSNASPKAKTPVRRPVRERAR